MDEFSIFAFAEAFARDFGRLDIANKFFGVVGVLGSIAGPTYFTTRYVTRRLMRRRADDLKMERDGLQKALDAGERIRRDLEKDIRGLNARLRLESPIEWIALAKEARATGSEGKAIRLLSDAFDGTADQLGAIARDLSLHHLTTMALTPKQGIERAERFARMAHACRPSDEEAAEILAEINEIKTDEKLSAHLDSSLSSTDGDELIDRLYGGKGDSATLVQRLIQMSISATNEGHYKTSLRLALFAERTGVIQLGSDHLLTLSATFFVAVAQDRLGRSIEALEIIEGLLPIEEEVRGADDPHTLVIRSMLARILESVGRYTEALEIAERLLPVQERVTGAEHPETISTHLLRAILLNALGRSNEALEIADGLLPVQERVLGAEHPETLVTRHFHAATLGLLGRSDEELENLETLRPILLRVFGAEHPETNTLHHNLAFAFNHFGRSDEALEILEGLLSVRRKTFGEEHPATLSTHRLHAATLGYLGRSDEALAIIERLLPLEEKAVGAEHPRTLSTRHLHAHVLDTLGRSAEALEILDAIVPVWRTKVHIPTADLKKVETLWEKLKAKE